MPYATHATRRAYTRAGASLFARADVKAEKHQVEPPPAPASLSKAVIGAIRFYKFTGRTVRWIAHELGLDLNSVKAVVKAA